jgi:hypothetical protein
MGDRGNIKVYDERGSAVYLYTHWRGSEIYRVAKTVLALRERWDDVAYLTRMLFCELVRGEEFGSTGFGISTFLCDNEHTIIGIRPSAKEVSFENEDGTLKGKMSFEDFVSRKDKYST